MKWRMLILSILWLVGCAASDRSSPALISDTPTSFLTRSVERTPTIVITRSIDMATSGEPTPLSSQSLEVTPTFAATHPIDVATPGWPTPSPVPITRSQPTATAALPGCPPLPEPIEVKTPAAVQHFEHGLMFWLQERNEIWTLIVSPLEDQFYWRILPNLWMEGQPESDPQLQPPAGRFQPVRGFGYAWRLGGDSQGSQRTDLGWALDQELGFDTTLIYYPQGFYSTDCTWMPKSGIYELRDEHGTVYQFVGAGGIARIVTSKAD